MPTTDPANDAREAGQGEDSGAPAETRRRARGPRIAAVAAVLAVVALIGGMFVVSRGDDSDGGATPDTNEMFDEGGQMVLPLPALAGDIALTANDDGSSQLSFDIEYSVFHTGTVPTLEDMLEADGSASGAAATPKADMAVVHVGVYPVLAPGGPIRSRPAFEQVVTDRALTQDTTTSSYSFRIPPNATDFLRTQGLDSTDGPTRTQALRHVDIDVQQMRDFKVVDGRWDWQQGRAYTAADQPVTGATTQDSVITVDNDTGDGIYGQEIQGDGLSQADDTPVDDTDVYGTNLTLAGSAVECIDQGNGSNPQGFGMLNGWDIEDGLAPGTLPPGASVSQQVNADESLGTSSLDIAQETATAATQILLASLSLTTPGVKSAVSQTVMLALGLTEFADPITFALGVPIMAILGMVDGIYKAMTNSCASFANVFNLTAIDSSGATSSYSWGDQSNGLQDVYDSASFGGTAVTNNVQLAPSPGIVSVDDGGPLTTQPYLEQVATTSCGTETSPGCMPPDPSCADASDPEECDFDETSTQDYGQNVVALRWTDQNPCPFPDEGSPYGPVSPCLPVPSDLAALPQVSIPGTSLCGTANALCPTLAAPNSDASEVAPQDVPVGDPYVVAGEYQPADDVVGIAALDDTSVYGATSSGSVQRFTPEGGMDAIADMGSPISSMIAFQDTLLVALENGGLYSVDPQAGTATTRIAPGGSSITRMIQTGGLVYLVAADEIRALMDDWQVNAVPDWGDDLGGGDALSVAVSPDFLFVGGQDGYVARCDLTDCGSSWTQANGGGFDSDANTLTTVGDTLYVGLQNGAQAQIDGNSLAMSMVQGAGSEGMSIGGMATVDGNVFVGGCIGQLSPISGDMLGVQVMSAVGQYEPYAPYPSTCQNPDETTTQFKGFDPSSYVMVPTPAAGAHPPLVFVAFSINSGNFVYALESVAPFTGALCLSDDDCPSAPAPLEPATSAAPAPVGSVAALGDPQVVSSCDLPDAPYTQADQDTPLATSAGDVTDGFLLQPAVSADEGCTTTFAWNLSNGGTYPYALWQANVYGQEGAIGTTLQVLQTDRNPLGAVVAGQVQAGDDSWPSSADGAQISAGLAGIDALVLSLQTAAGADDADLVFTADTLTSTGQPIPLPVPLQDAPPAAAPCALAHPALASSVAALYPLDDVGPVALDVSGNQNNGLIVQAQAYDVAPGPSAGCPGSGALQFSGNSTQVALPTSLDSAVQGSQLSVLAWVNPAYPSGTSPSIVANGDPQGGGVGFDLWLQQDTMASFSVTGSSGQTVTVQDPGYLLTQQWHQVAGVVDATSVAVYVDGQPVATAPLPDDFGTISTSPDPVVLGQDQSVDSEYFQGSMADVAIVPTGLSAAQIQSIDEFVTTGAVPPPTTSSTTTTTTTAAPATSTPSSTPGSITTSTTSPAPPTTTAAPQCVFVNAAMAGKADALWLLNDRSPTAVDSSGHGNDATISNAVAYDQAPGPATGCASAGALQLDGSSTFVTAPGGVDAATTGAGLSVVSFFKLGDTSVGQPRVVANDATTDSGNGFQLVLSSDGGAVTGGSFDVGASGGTASAQWSAPLQAGVWYQYVGTYDGTTVTAYLNGQPVGTASTSGTVNAGAAPVSMGYDPVGSTDFLQGYLADVAILDGSLDAGQIANMWAASQRLANAPDTAGPSPTDPTGLLLAGALLAAASALPLRRRRRLATAASRRPHRTDSA